ANDYVIPGRELLLAQGARLPQKIGGRIDVMGAHHGVGLGPNSRPVDQGLILIWSSSQRQKRWNRVMLRTCRRCSSFSRRFLSLVDVRPLAECGGRSVYLTLSTGRKSWPWT